MARRNEEMVSAAHTATVPACGMEVFTATFSSWSRSRQSSLHDDHHLAKGLSASGRLRDRTDQRLLAEGRQTAPGRKSKGGKTILLVVADCNATILGNPDHRRKRSPMGQSPKMSIRLIGLILWEGDPAGQNDDLLARDLKAEQVRPANGLSPSKGRLKYLKAANTVERRLITNGGVP